MMESRKYAFEGNDWVADTIEPLTQTPKAGGLTIIGIAGPSGVGKTTLSIRLSEFFVARGRHPFLIGLDDFLRSPKERSILDEWGPGHVRLDELGHILRSIRAGKKVFQTLRFVRKPTKNMIAWKIDINEIDLVIFEGLYAISDEERLGSFFRYVDVAIYLKAAIDDMKRWRFEQEMKKPQPRTEKQMRKHWDEGILPDIRQNIKPSEANADLVFLIDKNHRFEVFKKGKGPVT